MDWWENSYSQKGLTFLNYYIYNDSINQKLGKMNKYFITLLFVFTSINFSYSQEWELQGTKLHVPLKADAGEVVAMSNEVLKEVRVQITEDFEVKKGYLNFAYKEGVIYPLRRSKDGYDLYYAHDKKIAGKYWGVGINEDDPEDVIAVLVSPDGDLVKLKKYKINDKVKMVDHYQKCTDCYTQELIYVGMKGSELLFTYQEVVGVLNKVRAKNEFTSSFNPDQIIEFKGLNLKMLKATNSAIEYEVLERFSPLR